MLYRICAINVAFAATAGVLMAPPTQADDGTVPRAVVHVVVTDPFGERVPRATVRLLARDQGRELAPSGRSTEIAGVPYGYYTVSATDPGGGIAVQELIVNCNPVWIHVGLSFPPGNRAWPAGELSITGTVEGPIAGPNWWARAAGVFLHTAREAPISREGRFRIEGLEMGSYVVEIFDGAKLRHAETLELDTARPDIKLRISVKPGP